jgi:hypothetical protein
MLIISSRGKHILAARERERDRERKREKKMGRGMQREHETVCPFTAPQATLAGGINSSESIPVLHKHLQIRAMVAISCSIAWEWVELRGGVTRLKGV